MAKFDLAAVWRDIVIYRRAYLLTVVASFGGMVGTLTLQVPQY
jgi:SP family sugar:H+ symporter-like MFS transporter